MGILSLRSDFNDMGKFPKTPGIREIPKKVLLGWKFWEESENLGD